MSTYLGHSKTRIDLWVTTDMAIGIQTRIGQLGIRTVSEYMRRLIEHDLGQVETYEAPEPATTLSDDPSKLIG